MRILYSSLVLGALLFGGVPTAEAQRIYGELTVSTAAVDFTDTSPLITPSSGPYSHCIGQVEDADIRFTVDGTTPTSSTGTPVASGDYIRLNTQGTIEAFSTIRSGGSNATVRWTCTVAEEFDILTSGGAGGAASITQHLEDAPHTTGDEGNLVLVVRQDSQSDLAADGDYVPMTINASGELRVTGGSGTAPTHNDDAVFTAASDDITPIAGFFDDTTPDSVDENDAGIVRMSGNRNLYTTLRDAAGNERGANVDASNRLTVIADLGSTDNAVLDDIVDGTLQVQVSGDALTALQLIDNVVQTEDTGSGDGDSGIVLFARRTASPVDTSGADADYEALQMDNGRLWASATIDAALPAGTNDIGDVDLELAGTAVSAGNGASDTGTVRVTVASDSTGVLSVDDNGGALTVDNGGTFVIQEDGAALTALQLIDDIIAVDDTTTHTTGATAVANIGAVATPTDGAVTANDIGMVAMSLDRRLHVDAQIVGTDAALDVSAATVTVDLGSNNDVTLEGGAVLATDGTAGPANALSIGGTESGGTFQEILVDSDGNVQVDCSNCTGSGVTHNDDAAFTAGTDDIAPVGYMFDDTTPDSVDEGDAGVARMSANRVPYATLRDAAGNERGANVDASNRLTVVADLGSTDNAVLDDIANGIPLDASTNDIGDVDLELAGTAVSAGNGTTDTGTIRVTVSSDSTGVLSVDDNGGALTVDNGGTFVVQVDGDALTALQLIDDALFVDDTATHSTGTTKLIGIGAVATPTDSTLNSNDIGMLSMTDDRKLWIAGTYGDDGNFPLTDPVFVFGGYLDEVAPDSVNEGDAGAVRMSANRNMYMQIRDAAGNERGVNVDASNQLAVTGPVTNAGTFAVQEDGAALTALQIIDDWDDVHDSAVGSDGTLIIFESKDQDGVAFSTVTAEGDAVRPAASLEGVLYTMCVTEDGDDVCTVTADSEMPAAATLADNTSTPSAPAVGAFMMAYDGTNWDFVRASSADIGNNDANTGRIIQSQTLSHFDDDLDETAVAVATGASELCGFWVTNQASTTRWIKFYNVAQGSVIVGTTAETIDIGIPGNSTDDVTGSLAPGGGCIDFGTALTMAATTDLGGNTAPSANDIVITVFYRE